MKDLHCKISETSSIMLDQLCKYCRCNKTKLIETLIELSWRSAKVQANIQSEDELEDLETSFYVMVITEIFNYLYPPVEDINL